MGIDVGVLVGEEGRSVGLEGWEVGLEVVGVTELGETVGVVVGLVAVDSVMAVTDDDSWKHGLLPRKFITVPSFSETVACKPPVSCTDWMVSAGGIRTTLLPEKSYRRPM